MTYVSVNGGEDKVEQALRALTDAIEEAKAEVDAATKRKDLLELAAQTLRDAVGATRQTLLPSTGVASATELLNAGLGNGVKIWGPVTTASPPSTVEAVRRVLSAPVNQGKYFSVNALVTLMQNEGVLRDDLRYPKNTVLEAAKRLVARHPDYYERSESSDGTTVFRMRPVFLTESPREGEEAEKVQ